MARSFDSKQSASMRRSNYDLTDPFYRKDAVLKLEISLNKRHHDARVAPHIIKRPVPFRRLFV